MQVEVDAAEESTEANSILMRSTQQMLGGASGAEQHARCAGQEAMHWIRQCSAATTCHHPCLSTAHNVCTGEPAFASRQNTRGHTARANNGPCGFAASYVYLARCTPWVATPSHTHDCWCAWHSMLLLCASTPCRRWVPCVQHQAVQARRYVWLCTDCSSCRHAMPDLPCQPCALVLGRESKPKDMSARLVVSLRLNTCLLIRAGCASGA
jgi:hypothetical protein